MKIINRTDSKIFQKSGPLIILCFFVLSTFNGMTSTKSSSSKLASPEKFSGALKWAHKEGILGANQKAVVLEFAPLPQGLVNYYDLLVQPRPWSESYESPDEEHCHAVIDVLYLMAPRSIVLLMDEHIDQYAEFSKTYKGTPFLKNLEETSVVNCSGIPLTVNNGHGGIVDFDEQVALKMVDPINQLLNHTGKRKVFVWAAGNAKKSLSEATPVSWSYSTPHIVLSKTPTLRESAILVGSVDHGNNSKDNFPGEKIYLQEIFLCALGDKIEIDFKTLYHGYFDGTSGAAPIVTGAFLLIAERYPQLSALEIKEVLLESASKEFVRFSKSDDGWDDEYTFVFDPLDGPPNMTSREKEGEVIKAEPFDPSIYGKGILDLRAAFVYADLKVKSLKRSEQGSPTFTKKQLGAQMKRILKEQATTAAIKIQAAFRGNRARKNLSLMNAK